MTRISRTSNIDMLQNVERTNSRSIEKKYKPSAEKSPQHDFSELKKTVSLIVENTQEPPEKQKKKIIKEIIKWQFGEANFSNVQFKLAYEKLLKAADSSDVYQNIINTFLEENKQN